MVYAVAFVGNRHILCIHFVHALAHIFIIRLMLFIPAGVG